MVVGTLQHVPSKGRISIMRIQNFTVRKRHSVIKLAYGFLLVVIATITAAINPIQLVTDYMLDMREGSFIYNMWEAPTYPLMVEVWMFNYTNVEQYLTGVEKVMRVKEVGPFTYHEIRTNKDIVVDKERGIVTMRPQMHLELDRENSIDDPLNLNVTVPNIVLIAISTLAADRLGYIPNAGAYISMTALGSKVFKQLSGHQLLWGYDDPLVTIANGLLPGWIDFRRLGILDRIYADKNELSEVELKDVSRRYSLNKWGNSSGLKEQGYKEWNTSIPCNRITGTFEGLMLPANFEKGRNFTIFRKQACRSFPFHFTEGSTSDYGFTTYKYNMDGNAFSKSSPYECSCTENCLPEGLIDISSCYYGFPITLSKPHLVDVDPAVQAQFEGMTPDAEKYASYYELEPTIGAPINFAMQIQVNLAARMSPGNPIIKPVKDKILPIMWLKLFCKSPPQEIITLLRLRLVIGPPLYITVLILIFIAGFILGAQGFYRIWKPRYKIIPPTEAPAPMIRRKSQERRRSSVHENIAFKDDDELAKEAVSLLAINEEESDFVELIIDDNELD